CRASPCWRCESASACLRSGRSASSSLLPAGLRHAGDGAVVRELAQADPAEAELLEHRARAAALVAARVVARLELGPALLLDDERRLGHALLIPSVVGCEREPEAAQECERLLV